MSIATLEEDEVVRTLELTAHESRVLHLVLGVVIDRPGTFGVRGNGSAETKRILIETAGCLQTKLGTPPPAQKTKPAAVKKKPVAAAAPPAAAAAPPAVPVPEFRPAVVAPAPAAAPEQAETPAPVPPSPAPTPVERTTATNGNGTKHFLIAYSRTKKKPVDEREFDSYQEAFGARSTVAAQWTDTDDVEMHVISGPNRKVLVTAQPQYFRARPPKARVEV